MTSIRQPFALALAAFLSVGVASAALADTPWQKAHPRREEVNNRLANQNRRIHDKVQDGQMTHAQAAQIRQDDRGVRQEERDMAGQDGSHITKSEQRVLNQQENVTSRDIRGE